MEKGKHEKPIKRDQGDLVTSEPRSSTIEISRYLNKLENQELDLKLHFMMLIEDFKKEINNFF